MNNGMVYWGGYRTYAKLNLSLFVYPKSSTGYHPIHGIFQSISLFDTLTIHINPHKKEFKLTSTDLVLPTDERNVLRNVYDRFSSQIPIGLHVSLEKRIPLGSGMGGASSNAAAFLSFLNGILGWKKTTSQLMRIAKSFGADIPFFFSGGRALVQGIGEKIRPLPPGPFEAFLLIHPGFSSSTPAAFRLFDAQGPPFLRRPLAKSIQAGIGPNELKPAVFKAYPVLSKIEEKINSEYRKTVYMSGSGTTLFLPFVQKIHAQESLEKFRAILPEYEMQVVEPTPCGFEL